MESGDGSTALGDIKGHQSSGRTYKRLAVMGAKQGIGKPEGDREGRGRNYFSLDSPLYHLNFVPSACIT